MSPVELKIQRVVFWQNILSIHQSAFVRALAARPAMQVWFAFEEDLPKARRAMGWTEPNYGSACVLDARVPENWRRLVSMSDAQTCHAFGSYFQMPAARAAFECLRPTPCQRVWTTEAFNFYGWRGWIRLWRARWLVRRQTPNGFHKVMAMGRLGTEFFRRAGIRPHCLREFAYLVEPPAATPLQPAPEPPQGQDPVFRFLYVGQMIPRKGVDLLLQAASRLPQEGWRLDLIGDGPQAPALARLAAEQGIAARVHFLGNLPQSQTLAAIRAADALVLPSRWDGWGAVVNEALMAGTPALVSQACGAASLIVSNRCGRLFRRAAPHDLFQALLSTLRGGKVTPAQREALQRWAAMACGAAPLADYFLNCVQAPPHWSVQQPPWQTLPPA